MRILMVNRTTEMTGDTERIMYQLAESLKQMGHEICFFATEEKQIVQKARSVKKRRHWYELSFEDSTGLADALRAHKARKMDINIVRQTAVEEAYIAPPLTADYSSTYLVTCRPVTLTHQKHAIFSHETAAHMRQFLQETPVDAALVFNINRSLTWSVVSELKSFSLPVWVMLTDLQPVCPAGDCLVRTAFGGKADCHRCCQHESPRNEKFIMPGVSPGIRSLFPCVLHRCVNESFVQSFAAIREQNLLRAEKLYDLPDGYMTMSVYHQRMMVEADFTIRQIASVDVPLSPAAFVPMHRERSGYMMYIGEISYEHGTELLIRALAMCINSEDLVLCGEGPDVHALEELAEELNVRDRLHFMGSLKALTLRKLMAEASCLIVPSLCEENAPWGLLEMQALGKPAIAADRGVLADRVIDHRSGLLFEDGNAADLAQCMDEIHDMTDEALRRLGDNAAEDARRRYDPAKYAARVLSLLSGESTSVDRGSHQHAIYYDQWEESQK